MALFISHGLIARSQAFEGFYELIAAENAFPFQIIKLIIEVQVCVSFLRHVQSEWSS
jgi:hypothetical protein